MINKKEIDERLHVVESFENENVLNDKRNLMVLMILKEFGKIGLAELMLGILKHLKESLLNSIEILELAEKKLKMGERFR